MPAKVPKPRIAIYLKPHVYETIKRLSELNGEPMSRIVAELIEAVGDPLMRTVALLEAAAAAPKQIKDGLRGSLESMERELYGVAGYTMGQVDWLINEMGREAPGPGSTDAAAAGGRGGGGAVSAVAEAKLNPHVVTRGSGSTTTKKIKDLRKPKKGAKHG